MFCPGSFCYDDPDPDRLDDGPLEDVFAKTTALEDDEQEQLNMQKEHL